MADKKAALRLSQQKALGHQLAIGRVDRIDADAHLRRQLPFRGQALVIGQLSAANLLLDLLINLYIEWFSVFF